MTEQDTIDIALVVSRFLHKKDSTQTLVYHQCRGLATEIAQAIKDHVNDRTERAQTCFTIHEKGHYIVGLDCLDRLFLERIA
jgi:hypothetical protein